MVDTFKHIVGGNDIIINDRITVRNPTLSEMREYGEDRYNMLISAFVMRPYDAAVMLWDCGLDFRQVSEYDLFRAFCRVLISDPDIIIRGVDFSELQDGEDPVTGEPILFGSGVVINPTTYKQIVDSVRALHFVSTKNEINPGNSRAFEEFITQSRRKANRRKNESSSGQYGELISSLVNLEGFKYNYETVFNLHISQFWDAFYRINKIQDYRNTMGGIYSGCVDTKKLNKEILNWFGKIDINYAPEPDKDKAVAATGNR